MSLLRRPTQTEVVMSYITVDDVRSLAKTTSGQSGSYRTQDDSTAADAGLQNSINASLAAIDNLVGQHLVGFDGIIDVPQSDIRGTKILLPRFRSVAKVEYRYRGDPSWVELDTSNYETIPARRGWGGYEGLYSVSGSFSSYAQWRITGVFGWGWDADANPPAHDYTGDPVPPEMAEYAKIQSNYLNSRGKSSSGQVFGSEGNAITIGGGFWHNMVFRQLRDWGKTERHVLDGRYL